MITQLDLYILNNDNSVAPFPSEAEQIVLYDFTFEAQRMGSAPEITATIQANGSLENSLTTKVFCEYNGERYFLKNLPSSAKENTDPRYSFDLTFVSERTILDNVYMIDAVQGDNNIDRYQSNSTNIVFMGTIEECVARLNAAMTYAGVGYSVVLDEGITTESKLVSFQDKFFTEALQEIVNIHNIPYYYVGKVIHFGWSQATIPTIKYGDGLLSIDKSTNTERIVNRATATGSSENIPYYYPNPTPRGEIRVTHGGSIDLVVDNYYKASKIPEGTTLAYRDAWGKVDLFAYYPYYMGSIDVFSPPVEYDKKEKNGVIYDGNARSFFFAGIKTGANYNLPIDVDIEAVFKATMDNPFNSNVEIRGLQLYEDNNGVLKAIDSQIDYSYDLDLGEWGKSNTLKLTLKISLKDIPSDSIRFLSVELKNNQGLSNHIPVRFSFNNYQYGHDAGWYIKSSNEHYEGPVDLADYGIRIVNDAKDDEIGVEVINKIPFATTLMPPVYRESNGAQRFYNAINGEYEGVIFENEYSKENPKEAITTFEDIKPTIVGVTNAKGERIDIFVEFAYDLNDSDETEQTDESSESFIHPYFYAKLRQIDGANGFNIFAQAIESGEMTIEMTSGHCGACKFVIAVDENTQRNLVMVDDNGDLVYDEVTGNVKMADDAIGLDRQNDTQNYEVWIALKKDINTFGTVMPMANSTIKPSIDDTFVITNILLPQAYFTAAEKKLEDEIISFLLKNNTFQFRYSVNFSRIFLKKREDVSSQLSENVLIPIEYNGKESLLYVSSYTYRKQKADVLPEVSISLTDKLISTPSVFQQTINSVQTNTGKAVSKVEYKTNHLVKEGMAEARSMVGETREMVGETREMVEETREMVEETLGGYVSIYGEETIWGKKNFVGGVEINGQELVYDAEKNVWQLMGDLIVTGAVTMFGSLSGFTPSTVMDAVLVDGTTIVKTRNSQGQWQLTATGGGGSGGTGGGLTAAEVNVLIEAALVPYALKTAIPTDNNQLSNSAGYITASALTGYASEQWVSNQGYAKQSSLDGVDNRLKSVETFFATSDTDNLVNKWAEIVAFLNATEGDTLDNILKTKANQSALDDAVASLTTEIGKKWTQNDAKIANWDAAYGWGNHANAGYAAKTYVDGELAKYVKLAVAQSIEAQHNFVNGLKIGGLGITKSQDDVIYVDANLVVRGAVTMFGSGATIAPSIWASIPFDDTMEWNGSEWTVVGGGSGSVNEATVNNLIYEYLTQNSYAKISDISSALTGYATQSWVGNNYLSLSGGSLLGGVTITAGNLIVSQGDTVVGNLYPTSDASVDLGQGVRRWKNIYLGGYLSWGNSVDMTDIGDWNALKGNYGLRIISSITADSGAPYTYATALHVKGRYGFELAVQGGDIDSFAIRSITHNRDWKEILHSGNIGLYKAGSATKLQTARKIWGQSFDGTGDITGLLTDVDGIRGSMTDGGYIGGRNKGLGATDGGSMIYNYSASPITFHINGSERMRITNGGNVAIGSTSADELLHVHGTAKASLFKSVNGYTFPSSAATYCGLVPNSVITSGGNSSDFWLYNTTDIKYQASNHLFVGGNVAIGGTTADAKLHIHGDARVDGNINLYGGLVMGGAYTAIISNNVLYVGSIYHDTVWGGTTHRFIANNGSTVMSIDTNGNTTINGDLLTTGAITMFSQLSMKNVIDYDGLSLAQLSQIRPARFTWKDSRDTLIHAGGIADDVMQVLPEVVHRTSDDKLTMDYGSAAFYIGASLIKPVIDHERRISDLERENKQLKQQLEQLSAA